MTDEFSADTAQFKALMEVMNAITGNKAPLLNPHELASRSTLRALQWAIDDLNALDNGELIDTLNQARTEIKYLCSIITDLKHKCEDNETELRRLENLVHRG